MHASRAEVLQDLSSTTFAVHSTIFLVNFSGAGPPFSQLYLTVSARFKAMSEAFRPFFAVFRPFPS